MAWCRPDAARVGVASSPDAQARQLVFAEGQIAEINFGIEEWIERVAAKLRNGYLITIDYGAEAMELYGAPERRARRTRI